MEKKQGLGMSPCPASAHQRVLNSICSYLDYTLNPLEFQTVFDIDLKKNGKIVRNPDVVVWGINKSRTKKYPVVTIEVVKDKRGFNYSYNSIMHVYREFKTVEESYIYDYVADKWYKVERNGEVYEGDLYSDLLSVLWESTVMRYKRMSWFFDIPEDY